MEPDLKSVHENMIRIGLGALTHANWHATYNSMDNECWSELSVLQAAHAAELLIKARIAQEHPLLIFEQTPKPLSNDENKLDYRRLVNEGRTYQYSDLPNRLWAATGIKLQERELFSEFGKLRNSIQHFSPPEKANLSQLTLEFIFGVIDPFINQSWGLFAIDYNEDPEPYEYFVPAIIEREVMFLVSPESVENTNHMDISWPDNSTYVGEMQTRIKEAKEGDVRHV